MGPSRERRIRLTNTGSFSKDGDGFCNPVGRTVLKQGTVCIGAQGIKNIVVILVNGAHHKLESILVYYCAAIRLLN